MSVAGILRPNLPLLPRKFELPRDPDAGGGGWVFIKASAVEGMLSGNGISICEKVSILLIRVKSSRMIPVGGEPATVTSLSTPSGEAATAIVIVFELSST